MACPCGQGASLEACCGPVISGDRSAETAEALMRSRYSAHVVGDVDYIVATTEPSRADGVDRVAISKWAHDTQWCRLDVLRVRKGGRRDEAGEIEFIAWYLVDGVLRGHHERSTFRRVDGRWFFVEGGVVSLDGGLSKLKRNAACPCGSGLKFKACHGVS